MNEADRKCAELNMRKNMKKFVPTIKAEYDST